ncbi:MAG: hypothetical protein EU539_09425 [Promethearchaeota archaeon]|nr:MAG: hypothetical protein EU539_09425 [Candidatus Lokiarchaeota archaeon]
MILQQLSPEILRQSLTSLVMVVISLIIGIRILTKYFKVKQKTLLTVGIAWICLTTPWWGEILSLISFLFTRKPLDAFTFLLIVNIFIPVSVVSWIYSYCEILKVKREKLILIILIIISVIYDVLIIILLSIDTTLVGVISERFTARQADFVVIFQISALLTLVLTGFRFSYVSMKSDDKKTEIKGRFLFAAFLLFLIGAALDALIFPMDFITLVITRILLITSSICYYFGFFLPEKVASLFIKS